MPFGSLARVAKTSPLQTATLSQGSFMPSRVDIACKRHKVTLIAILSPDIVAIGQRLAPSASTYTAIPTCSKLRLRLYDHPDISQTSMSNQLLNYLQT